MRWLATAALLGLILAQTPPSQAANIESIASGRYQVITFSGPIEFGDAAKFSDMLKRHKISAVLLNSPGGLVLEGIEIGRAVRRHGLRTIVDYQTDCASACALVWLAGKKRELRELGRVGLHASYEFQGEQKIERGWSNALIGGFLRELDYSDAAILLATSTPPDEIHWLSKSDAKRVGIEVDYVLGGVLLRLTGAWDETRRMDWPSCNSLPQKNKGSSCEN